jgi:hypothetical protein
MNGSIVPRHALGLSPDSGEPAYEPPPRHPQTPFVQRSFLRAKTGPPTLVQPKIFAFHRFPDRAVRVPNTRTKPLTPCTHTAHSITTCTNTSHLLLDHVV